IGDLSQPVADSADDLHPRWVRSAGQPVLHESQGFITNPRWQRTEELAKALQKIALGDEQVDRALDAELDYGLIETLAYPRRCQTEALVRLRDELIDGDRDQHAGDWFAPSVTPQKAQEMVPLQSILRDIRRDGIAPGGVEGYGINRRPPIAVSG